MQQNDLLGGKKDIESFDALFETGVSLLEPEESHRSEYGYFRVFSHTHVTPPWRAIGSRNQKKAGKREKKKVGYRAPAALPVQSKTPQFHLNLGFQTENAPCLGVWVHIL